MTMTILKSLISALQEQTVFLEKARDAQLPGDIKEVCDEIARLHLAIIKLQGGNYELQRDERGFLVMKNATGSENK